MNKKSQLDPLQAIIDQIRINDPHIKRLVEQHVRNTNTRHEQAEVIRRMRIQRKKLLEQLSLMKDKLKEGKADKSQIVTRINQLKKRNNALSDALGSCTHCWGEDPACDHCSGNGMPGWRNSNKRLFNIYVRPCLDKIYEQNKN